MILLSYIFLALFGITGIGILVVAIVYLKARTNPTSPMPDEKKWVYLKGEPQNQNPNSQPNNPANLSLKQIWLQKIRDGEVEYKTFQGRGKAPIVLDGYAFEYIRNKEPQSTESNEPNLDYDPKDDPDTIKKTKKIETEETPTETN